MIDAGATADTLADALSAVRDGSRSVATAAVRYLGHVATVTPPPRPAPAQGPPPATPVAAAPVGLTITPGWLLAGGTVAAALWLAAHGRKTIRQADGGQSAKLAFDGVGRYGPSDVRDLPVAESVEPDRPAPSGVAPSEPAPAAPPEFQPERPPAVVAEAPRPVEPEPVRVSTVVPAPATPAPAAPQRFDVGLVPATAERFVVTPAVPDPVPGVASGALAAAFGRSVLEQNLALLQSLSPAAADPFGAAAVVG